MARPRIEDRVLFLLGLAALLALSLCGFLTLAPNRLARGTSLAIWQMSPSATLILVALSIGLILQAVKSPLRRSRLQGFMLAAGLFYACLLIAGLGAKASIDPNIPAFRVSLGAGFWITLSGALLAILHVLQETRTSLLKRVGIAALLALPPVALAYGGVFDALSLAREYETHREALVQAFADHLAMVGIGLGLTLIIGLPIILLLRRHAALQRFVYSGLGVIQAIPSIALFGLLIAPLSSLVAHVPALGTLGISGTGRTPAILALVLYCLLPLVRNGVTGLAAVPDDVLNAAKGLGFDKTQRLWKVELPLALPSLLSGLRVVTIQAIGLASVAALIGAGGLGTFIFQGIGQYALDLVLIGALPIIGLALSADLFFQLLLARLRRST